MWWLEVDGGDRVPISSGVVHHIFQIAVGTCSLTVGRTEGGCVIRSMFMAGEACAIPAFNFRWAASTKVCYLKEPGKWTYYHAGDFTVSSSCKSMKVKFSMM